MNPQELLGLAFDGYMEYHRARECKGKDCHEIENILAWLAHRNGIRATDIGTLKDFMLRYEQNCEWCKHFRNQGATP